MQMNRPRKILHLPGRLQMAYAERDSEAMRLAQRLKRSLASENTARDEVRQFYGG